MIWIHYTFCIHTLYHMHVFTIPVFFWRLLLPIHYSIGFLLTYIYQTVRPFASLTCSHMPMVFQRSCCTENDNLCVRLNIKIYFASIYLVKILCNIHERARTHMAYLLTHKGYWMEFKCMQRRNSQSDANETLAAFF